MTPFIFHNISHFTNNIFRQESEKWKNMGENGRKGEKLREHARACEIMGETWREWERMGERERMRETERE